MANRFPLILDTTDNNKIKEIQAGDNLNLTDNSIVGVQNITALGTIDATNITVAGNKLVAQAFADLTDTPSSFIGSPNYFVKVKADGTGLEYRPLSDLGNIEIDSITVDNRIVPSADNIGYLGTEATKFNEVVASRLKGSLISFNDEIVFDAVSGKISYAALQGAPTLLSNFTDDIGFLRTVDLDTTLAGLFDDGVPFETDIKGSVFADDSTILVDGVSGIITGDVLNSQVTTIDLVATTSRVTTTTATTINGPATGDLAIDAGTSGIINIGFGANTTAVNIENAVIEAFDQGSGLGIAQLTTNTDLSITAGNRVKIEGGVPFRFSSTTTALQLAIAAQEGDVIYNTSTSRLQMYQGGAWKDVNGNVEATDGTSNFNDVVVSGNLIVQGTTTSIETTNTTITDNVITLNQGEVGAGVTATTAGIEVDRGTETNKTLVWDDSIDKWTVGAETFVAAIFQGTLTGNVDGNLIADSISIGRVGAGETDIYGNVEFNDGVTQFQAGNAVTFNSTVDFNNTLNFADAEIVGFRGDIKGSIVGDDSTILVDGVAGKIVGDVENTEIITTTVQGRASADLNIYRGANGTVSLGDDASGSVSVSNSGINITSTAGVNVNGAATGIVNIGTGDTTGNVTIGKVGNITTVNGTFIATLTGNVIGDVTGDVTGNIDNTTLNIGATTATEVNIGNATSTTKITGTVSFESALVAANITADDSIVIQTEGNSVGEGITIAPNGTNTSINLVADELRLFGTPITDSIAAQGGIVGNIRGNVLADNLDVLIDSAAGTIVGTIVSNSTVSGTTITANTALKTSAIANLDAIDDLTIDVDGFININAGIDDAGLSKIQMDQAGINYIEITTEPINPANPADVANISINATAAAGDVVIGTTGSTRNQIVTINNATVNGTLVGTVEGTVVGALTGDVTGSVFSDDSAPMVDALNYALFSDTLSLTPLNTPPTNPINGMIAVADGTGWDPASNAKNTLVAYLGGAWVTVAAAA